MAGAGAARSGGGGVPPGWGCWAGSGSGRAGRAVLNFAAGRAAPSRNSSGKQMKCLKGYCEYRLKYDPLASANFSDKILQGLLFLSK